MADEALLWETFWHHVANTDGLDFTLTGSAVPGSGALTVVHHQTLYLAATLCLTLGSIFSRLARECLTPAFASLSDRARALALSSLHMDNEACFRALPKQAHLTSAQYTAVLTNREALRSCRASRQWGPATEELRSLCSPAFLMFLVWAGSPVVDPVLDFLYAFAQDSTSFVTPWLDCPTPYVDHLSFKAIHDRMDTVRSNSHLRTPAHKLSHLAERAVETLTILLKTVFLAAGECVNIPATELFSENIVRPTFAAVIATPTPQLPANTSLASLAQVSSELPTCSSLPRYTPNFIPEHNAQWFRSANYHFNNLHFPAETAARGDASAERVWHDYSCNVLRARSLCTQLSEQQVITHLSQHFQRAEPHFAVSEECRTQPGCTVVNWLTALREFFFTNQQFRYNIELAWERYRIGHARDFNELIHHIRVYYQLIFLDYTELPGKMTLHDFAWYLFEKMQHLLSPDCKTELAKTVQLCIPLSGVLEQMQLHLRTQATATTALELDPAHSFVSWCLKQLKFARETANTTRRYATVQDTRTTVDYAQLSTRTSATPSTTAGAAATKGPGHRRQACLNSDQPTGTQIAPLVQNAPATASPSTGPITRQSLPADVRESINRKGRPLTDSALRGIAARLPQWMNQLILHELDNPGKPDTLHGLTRAYSDARKPSYRLATSPLSCSQYLLKSYLIFNRPLCSICPHDGGSDRRHVAADCPELKKHCPAALQTFLANPANAGKGFLAVEPGQPIPHGTATTKRKCDSTPAVPQPPAATHASKRPKPANIR